MFERTGNWSLHLHCIQQSIPVYHAAGQLAYAKSARLYLQQMNSLHTILSEDDYAQFTKNGSFTLHQIDRFWAGNFTDWTIEHDLMRMFKTSGGMTRGRGITDSTLAKWVYCLPTTIPICSSLEKYCGIHTSTSDQHRDLSTGNIMRDHEDYNTFISWIQSHSPLSYDQEDCAGKVVCIANGVIAPKSVNCDDSQAIGLASADSVTNNNFADVKYRLNDRVTTIQTARNKTLIRGKLVDINPTMLFMKVAAVIRSPKELENCMKYEFSQLPPSLFKDGEMRSTPKSDLAKELKSNVMKLEYIPEDSIVVVDGGNFIHKVVWSDVEIYQDICYKYVNYADQEYTVDDKTIVFDGYSDEHSTKLAVQRQRASKCNSSEVLFKPEMKVTSKKGDFLGHPKNKTRLIACLTPMLKKRGFNVKQHKGDADS